MVVMVRYAIRNLSPFHLLVPSGRTALSALTLFTLIICPLSTAGAEEGTSLASTTSQRELENSQQELGRSRETRDNSNEKGRFEDQPEGSDEKVPTPDQQAKTPAENQQDSDEKPIPSEEGQGGPAEEPGRSAEEPGRSAEEPGRSAEEPGGPEPEELGSSDDEGLDGSDGELRLSLTAGLLSFVEEVSAILNDRSTDPPPNNTYSYETGFSSGLYPEPPVYLNPTESHSAIASTDCSGWLSYVLDTTAPLHRAALQSQRRLPKYNRDYEGDFLLQEGRRLWSRAYVVTHFLRSKHASKAGFVPVARLADVQKGDIVGYALGRYADPKDANLRRPGDTGHVFIVVGTPTIVSEDTENYDGNGSLSDRAAMVLAVPALDSSSSPHFEPDSRRKKKGRYQLPPNPPSQTAMAGGIGTGVIWFAVDDAGEVLQARIGPRRRYHDVILGAARMRDTIELIPEILDGDGDLLIEAFDNTPSHFREQAYGDVPVRLTGRGGIRVAGDGAVILKGDSDFSGGLRIDSGAVIVQSSKALGTGPVKVVGGALILERPAFSDHAELTISDDLSEGAIRLEFSGEDVVSAVQIGDHSYYLCGTLGSAESGATHRHPVFAGPGILRVSHPDFACPETEELADASEPATSAVD